MWDLPGDARVTLTAATGVAATRLPAGKGVTFHSFLNAGADVRNFNPQSEADSII